MSAKGRAVVDPLEYYPTAPWAVRPVMQFVGTPARVIDLGCGKGEIGSVVRETFPHAAIRGVEIDQERAALALDVHIGARAVYDLGVALGDVISPLYPVLPVHELATYDLVIMNPPFSNAAAFLHVARSLLRYGGTIAVLLRDGWVIPEDRAPIVPIRQQPKCDLVRLRRRPFPDATDYAWHIFKPFDPSHGGRWMVA